MGVLLSQVNCMSYSFFLSVIGYYFGFWELEEPFLFLSSGIHTYKCRQNGRADGKLKGGPYI